MRKRSEVRTSGQSEPARSTAAHAKDGFLFVVCPDCKLEQSREVAKDGVCARCGAVIPELGAAQQHALEEQAARQKAERVRQSEEAGVPAAKDLASTSKDPDPRLPPQENLSAMSYALVKNGYAVKIGELAQMPPDDRRMIAEWIGGRTLEPKSLTARFEKLNPDLGKPPPATNGVAPESPSVPRGTLATAEEAGTCIHALTLEEVTYTWGKESYPVAQYSMCEVGPFAATTSVRPGETRARALERLATEMLPFVEAERKRKLDGYARTLGQAKRAGRAEAGA